MARLFVQFCVNNVGAFRVRGCRIAGVGFAAGIGGRAVILIGTLGSSALGAALAALAVAAGLAFTAAGQALWRRITRFLAGSILGFLILYRKRDRCWHCNKLLTDREGILVDDLK